MSYIFDGQTFITGIHVGDIFIIPEIKISSEIFFGLSAMCVNVFQQSHIFLGDKNKETEHESALIISTPCDVKFKYYCRAEKAFPRMKPSHNTPLIQLMRKQIRLEHEKSNINIFDGMDM